MKELIQSAFKKYGYNLSDKQVEQFETYFHFLVEENEKYNLTAITQPKEVVFKHFVDSVLPEKEIMPNAKVIDVGTGAGFPGIPLKILRNDIKLTLLDSLQKRINFLNMLIEKLGLKDIQTVHGRAEDFTKDHREKFDIALSRAVASIPTLSEYLIPYVKVGGKILMYKGAKLEEELASGNSAIKILGANKVQTLHFSISEENSERFVLVLKKIAPTNKKYPRGKNLPKTKPLQ